MLFLSPDMDRAIECHPADPVIMFDQQRLSHVVLLRIQQIAVPIALSPCGSRDEQSSLLRWPEESEAMFGPDEGSLSAYAVNVR